MASLVFTAFSLEAYLNHIGPNVMEDWTTVDKLRPKEKLQAVAGKIGLEVHFGRRPWSIMKLLFGFRNDIAHGKSIKVKEARTLPIDKYENYLHDFAKTPWEAFSALSVMRCAPERMSRRLLGRCTRRPESRTNTLLSAASRRATSDF